MFGHMYGTCKLALVTSASGSRYFIKQDFMTENPRSLTQNDLFRNCSVAGRTRKWPGSPLAADPRRSPLPSARERSVRISEGLLRAGSRFREVEFLGTWGDSAEAWTRRFLVCGLAARRLGQGASIWQTHGNSNDRYSPQLRFIHIQVYTNYLEHSVITCLELDAVNIGWWISINACLVYSSLAPPRWQVRESRAVEPASRQTGDPRRPGILLPVISQGLLRLLGLCTLNEFRTTGPGT